MTALFNAEYYLSRKAEIMERDYGPRAEGWKRFLLQAYGQEFAEAVLKEARQQFEQFIPHIPYMSINTCVSHILNFLNSASICSSPNSLS